MIKTKHTKFILFSALIPLRALAAESETDSVKTVDLSEFVVKANAVSKLQGSPFNATSLSTSKLLNSTKTIGDALAKAPGMKVRESGGVGSDLNLSMDGFNGKHVAIFIDGVPQSGVGTALNLNNIPAGFADRVEVYRGVVPVAFGADAMGGVINIVTPNRRRSAFANLSYSAGSFNTHKASLSFGQKFNSGINYEFNSFANYSDNNYRILAPVENFQTGAINRRKLESVKRFNDTFHNEVITARLGVAQTNWIDKGFVELAFSNMYKEIQTGVRQEIVYGQKHRKGITISPSLHYGKRDFIVENLNLKLHSTLRFSRIENVDTAMSKYNWNGESAPLNSPGEQAFNRSRLNNRLASASLNASYRLADSHTFSINNAFNNFSRTNENLLTIPVSRDEISKETSKNILGISYSYQPGPNLSATAFLKHYWQSVAGPQPLSSSQDTYIRASRNIQTSGFGTAATYSLPFNLQAKASFEKAVRLPSVEEMFGDGDLEVGEFSLRPESSFNSNLNLSYSLHTDWGNFFADLGLIYRDTRDYIQRNILALSGGKSAATYINYGKVKTTGITLSARYSHGNWLNLGGSLSRINVRDNMKTANGSTLPNIAYGERIPNTPWLFADSDISLNWHNFGRKSNILTLTYDNQYTHSFCYYNANIGTNSNDYMVPNQFAHNIALSYTLFKPALSLSLECKNLTDARLYDNFSLQKAGRAFYATLRYNFSTF